MHSSHTDKSIKSAKISNTFGSEKNYNAVWRVISDVGNNLFRLHSTQCLNYAFHKPCTIYDRFAAFYPILQKVCRGNGRGNFVTRRKFSTVYNIISHLLQSKSCRILTPQCKIYDPQAGSRSLDPKQR